MTLAHRGRADSSARPAARRACVALEIELPKKVTKDQMIELLKQKIDSNQAEDDDEEDEEEDEEDEVTPPQQPKKARTKK